MGVEAPGTRARFTNDLPQQVEESYLIVESLNGVFLDRTVRSIPRSTPGRHAHTYPQICRSWINANQRHKRALILKQRLEITKRHRLY
jgi:hypothetical protein